MVEPVIVKGWEDGGIAQLDIICCNEKHEHTAHTEESWICPNCGTIIDFTWKGMEYKIRKFGNKEVKE